MFIDVHAHAFFDPGPGDLVTPEQLLARYDAIGVERAVLLPLVNPECSRGTVQSSEDILKMARENARFIPFCNIDPRILLNTPEADLERVAKHYRDKGCKGIGELCANLSFADPLVRNLFRAAEKAALPVLFHIAPRIGNYYGLYDEPGLPLLEESLRTFPKLTFLGHSQAFWAEIGRLETPGLRAGYPTGPIEEEGVVPKLLRAYPNLYGDLSAGSGYNALARDRAYAVKFLEEFQDRLLFGLDICAPETKTPHVDFLLELRAGGAISEKVFQKIARENVIRLLGLTD